MSVGFGSLQSFAHRKASTPATVTAANNGASLSGTTVQLGQAVAAVGNPGILLNNREIPMSSKQFTFNGTTLDLLIDDTNARFRLMNGAGARGVDIDFLTHVYQVGDIDGANHSCLLSIDDGGQFIHLGDIDFNSGIDITPKGDTFFYSFNLSGVGGSLKMSPTQSQVNMFAQNGALRATINLLPTVVQGQKIQLLAVKGIQTSDTNGSETAGVWLLGHALNAAVTFNNAKYVEVKIDDILYKLALCN